MNHCHLVVFSVSSKKDQIAGRFSLHCPIQAPSFDQRVALARSNKSLNLNVQMSPKIDLASELAFRGIYANPRALQSIVRLLRLSRN
jgi:hypothetical protein